MFADCSIVFYFKHHVVEELLTSLSATLLKSHQIDTRVTYFVNRRMWSQIGIFKLGKWVGNTRFKKMNFANSDGVNYSEVPVQRGQRINSVCSSTFFS